ncbi:MAG: L,D-transpeptidase family protein [Lachnospiraceae bacterium]|nr:L,D-transpeptidase family protein [Lachnospiraceae bacterium]
MRKRLFWKIFLFLCIAVSQITIVYIGLAVYYQNAFEYGTWINNVYCTGKSIDEVNQELSMRYARDGITVYDKERNAYQITAEDINYRYDFKTSLELYLAKQNSWLWVDSFWKIRDDKISPVISYDEELFDTCFSKMPFLKEGEQKDREVAIVLTERGYELLDERTNVLDIEEAKQVVTTALSNFETDVFLSEEGCYYDMELTEEMQKTLHEWELVKEFQDCHIVYMFGSDRIPVDASVVCQWILLNEDGSFALDESGKLQLREDAIKDFVASLAEIYDTVGKSRRFWTTNRGMITIEGGTYGNKLDQEAEVEYLTEAFLNKADEVHMPKYKQTTKMQGTDDIGNTYVEIDMGEQMMYYYLNGKLELETPIVTGNTSRQMGTPSGVNYVYLKQTDRILRGEGYASHVNFWMPVKGNVGIHDSAWRSSYGGTIYQTNGSHGCINTPYSAMTKLYEMVEVGTPVIMFY